MMLKTLYFQLKIVIFFIFVSRIGASLYSIFYTIKAENGERISPLRSIIYAGDHGYYVQFIGDPWSPLQTLIRINQIDKLKIWIGAGFYPGPIFPWLLQFTSYDTGRPYYLSLLYIGFSIITGIIWATHFKKIGSTTIEQLIIVCYPLSIYYTLLLSTEMVFSLFIGSLYILMSSEIKLSEKKLILSLAVLFLCIFTRPNSISLLPVFGYWIWCNRLKFKASVFYLLSIVYILLFLISSIYYLPYFIAFSSSSTEITYWDIPQREYLSGLFYKLPNIINIFLSSLLLIFSKLIYIVGMRPSYSGAALHLVLLRAAGGLVMLPGIFYIFLHGARFEKIFIFFFIFPILYGASQERYLLPIAPILLFYGFRFWKKTFNTIFMDK